MKDMKDLRDSFWGTLVGVHVGDSLGAPYETWSPEKIADDLAKRGGLQFFDYPNPWAEDGNGKILPAGRPTDDSDQTADLCFSLLECGGLNPEHLREALRDSVFRNKSRLWDGKATGAGGTTRDTLSDDLKRNQRGFTNTIGTNGSLMRSAPMALWFFSDQLPMEYRGDAKRSVVAMSAVTHRHQHSISACWIYTAVLDCLLLEREWLSIEMVNEMHERIWLRLRDTYDFPYDPGAWPARGTAEFSLYVALYALKHATSFADGISMAVKVGGDTDTYGAIAGGLLGAKFGYSGIPEEWRTVIKGHDVMIYYAERFYERIRR